MLLIIGVVALGSLFGGNEKPDAPAIQPLTSEQVTGCNAEIDKAARRGLVRARPAANRVNVDEVRWAVLPATEKTALLALLSCSAHGVAPSALQPMQFVVAYGYRSGKRLAMFGSEGMSYE